MVIKSCYKFHCLLMYGKNTCKHQHNLNNHYSKFNWLSGLVVSHNSFQMTNAVSSAHFIFTKQLIHNPNQSRFWSMQPPTLRSGPTLTPSAKTVPGFATLLQPISTSLPRIEPSFISPESTRMSLYYMSTLRPFSLTFERTAPAARCAFSPRIESPT